MAVHPYDHEPWISTYTGKKIWPLDPKAEDIEILDIAIGLSRICRFASQTRDFYSVAQHCVIASHLVPGPDALWALLHDAQEAYICDLPKPLKQLFPKYEEAEMRLTLAVMEKFELPRKIPDSVIEIDRFLLVTEAAQLMDHHPDQWHLSLGIEPDMDLMIDPYGPDMAFREFMQRFDRLTAGRIL